MNKLIYGMPREQYDALPKTRVNWSTAKLLARSPQHYLFGLRAAEQVETDAMTLGTGTHYAILEPEKFDRECVKWDGGTRRGKDWERFCAEHEGRVLLTEKQFDLCLAMQSAVRACSAAAPYLAGGRSEVTILWDYDAANGQTLEMKSRLDFLSDCGAIVDLKTTRDASPEAFGRQAWNLAYHGQAAIYVDGLSSATGRSHPYVIIAVENTPPHVVQVYRVPNHVLEAGREHYQQLLNQLAEYRVQGRWPGYADGPLDLELPRWAVTDDPSGLGLTFGDETEQGAAHD